MPAVTAGCDRASLHHFGQTRDGTPITANRRLVEADFMLGPLRRVPDSHRGCGGLIIAPPDKDD